MSALYCSALSLTIIAHLSLSPSLCGSVLPAMVWAADEKCVAPLRPISIELWCWNTLLWLKLYNKDWEELKKHMFPRIVSRNSCEMSECFAALYIFMSLFPTMDTLSASCPYYSIVIHLSFSVSMFTSKQLTINSFFLFLHLCSFFPSVYHSESMSTLNHMAAQALCGLPICPSRLFLFVFN